MGRRELEVSVGGNEFAKFKCGGGTPSTVTVRGSVIAPIKNLSRESLQYTFAKGSGLGKPAVTHFEGGPEYARMVSALLYCLGMTHRVGAKGQVVIPKDLRERVGLRPGADVEFELEGERISIAVAQSRSGLGGRFAGSGMAARLLDDRAHEPR